MEETADCCNVPVRGGLEDDIVFAGWQVLPPSQNKRLNFVLALVQSCIKLETLILGG